MDPIHQVSKQREHPIVHEFNDEGRHRLVVNGVAGAWAGYQFVAVNGSYRAVTQYWEGVFPEVFSLTAVEARAVYPHGVKA